MSFFTKAFWRASACLAVRSLALLLTLHSAAHAHASEQVFVLLLPTQFFIAGGCCAVTASILLISFLRAKQIQHLFAPVPLFHMPHMKLANFVIWWAMAALLVVLIVIGFFGPSDPLANLLPLSVWTVFWAGYVVLASMIGHHIHWPCSTQTRSLIEPQKPDHIWPGLLLFCLLGVFAIVDPAPEDPRRLAMIITGYLVFTGLGMAWLDPEFWLRQCEPFSILFRMIGALSPLQFYKKCNLGLPGWIYVNAKPPHLSAGLFCILFLGIGSFDGFKETFWWLELIKVNPLEFPGRSAVMLSSTLGLILFNIVLLGMLWLCTVMGILLAGRHNSPSLTQVFTSFSLSLLPIAIGYHASHFMVSFLINIQYIPIAMSDPFAVGANYFGWGAKTISTGFFNSADSVFRLWFTQVAIVVVSHILAVLIAHCFASTLFKTHRQALLSQLPLSCFMIAYTFFGLWLLATPRGA